MIKIGQAQIIELLESRPDEWLSTKDIKEVLGGNACVSRALATLRGWKALEFTTKATGYRVMFYYKFKPGAWDNS